MSSILRKERTLEVILESSKKIKELAKKNDFDSGRNRIIVGVIISMKDNPENWERFCSQTIERKSDELFNKLSSLDSNPSNDDLDSVCALCFIFLMEMHITSPNDIEKSLDIGRQFIIQNIDTFNDQAKAEIEHTLKFLPISLLKNLYHSNKINIINEFNSSFFQIEDKMRKWDEEFLKREEKIKEIRNSLEKYEDTFNFVGLYEGFNQLAIEKNDEKERLIFWIRITSGAVLLPIILELSIIYFNIAKIAEIKDGLILSLIPTVSLVAISIYYFRVLLFNYKSVKSQLLQIELRKTLCRFIQKYSSYSAELKKDDPNSLSKFENIIFSSILPETGKMPSTYDGLEQIGNLIKSIKS